MILYHPALPGTTQIGPFSRNSEDFYGRLPFRSSGFPQGFSQTAENAWKTARKKAKNAKKFVDNRRGLV
jgi:hypothetical protein